ncbi:MAG: CRISPR-associated endonuclease Cas2 [Candidatus Obscuribacterales bacterium]|nr:CRISPR-associated endonuclease Cas2 [Candidatus Obscuribacterales bacterium]
MIVLAIYDIENDGVRLKVSEACKDFGMKRIQYSAFLGDMNFTRRDELLLRLKRLLGKSPGNIQLIPLCDKDMRLRTIVDVPKPGEDPRPDANGK